MARTSQYVKIGKRKVELSNLKKVLFPDDDIVKAELIEYYLTLAPTILAHVKGRPLTLVRYPDGIEGETFFQKRRPNWAPEWIDHVSLGDDKKIDYILLTEPASVVWLANLACIELHQTHYHKPRFERPDYFVFDLDPPEGYGFDGVIRLAQELRTHLEGFGYHPFVKTTGRKGLHIVVPIEPEYDFKQIFDATKSLAQAFVSARPGDTTLHIKKESRKGRVLVDIYRNRQFQTIVSPYSVRGLKGAPVSTPLSWEQLDDIDDPSELNIYTVPDMVRTDGDQWEAIAAYASNLHTQRKPAPKKKSVGKSSKYKTPEQLDNYTDKRRFDKTPEPSSRPSSRPSSQPSSRPSSQPSSQPSSEAITATGRSFVVHRHHASRLHYDLRLEKDGTLQSWAVPKGLPPRPGIKRLAVRVEDHPLEYLTFEGTIPKGEYGGGRMWVYAQGRYEITKQKKDGFYFRLQSRELNAEYRTYKTKGKDWLLERIDSPQTDWLQDSIEPMLANSKKSVPDTDEFIYEVKWDGIRAMISLDEGVVRIHSRNQRDITEAFPELLEPDESFRGSSLLIDTEIVCLDEKGRPVFKDVINRMRQTSESAIKRGMAKHRAVCYVFDLLYLDGRPVNGEPLARRREWMEDVIKKGGAYRISETVEDGIQLFAAAGQLGLEGIMAKDRASTYHPGKRTSQWLKIKTRETMDCVIVGYTKGRGDRATTFGALHLAQRNGDDLEYVGKVGTGFDDRLLKNVLTELKRVKEARKRPIKEKPVDDAQSVWLQPRLWCEVQYASITNRGTLREPVFLRLRPDLASE